VAIFSLKRGSLKGLLDTDVFEKVGIKVKSR